MRFVLLRSANERVRTGLYKRQRGSPGDSSGGSSLATLTHLVTRRRVDAAEPNLQESVW